MSLTGYYIALIVLSYFTEKKFRSLNIRNHRSTKRIIRAYYRKCEIFLLKSWNFFVLNCYFFITLSVIFMDKHVSLLCIKCEFTVNPRLDYYTEKISLIQDQWSSRFTIDTCCCFNPFLNLTMAYKTETLPYVFTNISVIDSSLFIHNRRNKNRVETKIYVDSSPQWLLSVNQRYFFSV